MPLTPPPLKPKPSAPAVVALPVPRRKGIAALVVLLPLCVGAGLGVLVGDSIGAAIGGILGGLLGVRTLLTALHAGAHSS